MGRTNPTFRRVLGTIEDSWESYRRALRRRDQQYFDALFEYANQYADAAGYLNRDTPMLAVLFSIALGQEKRRQELEEQVVELREQEAKLAERVAELERRVAELEATGGDDA